MTEISIVGLDKADVLAALYNGARAQGLGFLHYTPEPMSRAAAQELIDVSTSFDYVKGRVVKVDLSGDSFDPWGYDRDNGEDAAGKVIDILRATGLVDAEEIELQSLENTHNQAEQPYGETGLTYGDLANTQ